MPDVFTLNRQPCRCGQVFGTWQSFKAHATVGDTDVSNHLNPAEIGLVQVQGEWVFPEVDDAPDTPVAAKRAPRGTAKPYVRAADRPSTEYERTCTVCNATFERPRKRGRPPTKCPTCRGA